MSVKHPVAFAVVGATVVLSGCAPQLHRPQPIPTAMPSVLLRSSYLAAEAQRRVAEVLYVQSHPAVIAVAPSHALAMDDRFSFHWEGPLSSVGLNLATAMGWSFEQRCPSPAILPQVYVDQHDVQLPAMLAAINRQAMPTAMLVAHPDQRTIVLQTPTPAQVTAWERDKHCAAPDTRPGTQRNRPKPPAATTPVPHGARWQPKTVNAQTVVFTLRNGHVRPLPMSPKGPNIPLQTALSDHWKLVIPAHPTAAEKAIAKQWRKAGGLLLRL